MGEINKKILIINADDVGLSDEINKAVRRGLQGGVISSVSLMACADTFKQATEMFHVIEKRDIGIHLTLTGPFLPCAFSRGGASFLSENGRFLKDYQVFFGKYMRGDINMDEVKREFSAQIEKVQQEGLTISHIDSHEHVHMFPGILDIVMRLAVENNIKYIRVPDESPRVLLKEIQLMDILRYSGLKVFVRGAKKKIREKGLLCNDFFWGHYHSGRLTYSVLSFMLDNMEEGVNELCVHPAYVTSGFLEKYPWYKNANNEIEALLDNKFSAALAEKEIVLVGHDKLKSV